MILRSYGVRSYRLPFAAAKATFAWLLPLIFQACGGVSQLHPVRSNEPTKAEDFFSLKATLEYSNSATLPTFDPRILERRLTRRSLKKHKGESGILRIRHNMRKPNAMCGARCYGHDGRDRELHQIFRGVRSGCWLYFERAIAGTATSS